MILFIGSIKFNAKQSELTKSLFSCFKFKLKYIKIIINISLNTVIILQFYSCRDFFVFLFCNLESKIPPRGSLEIIGVLHVFVCTEVAKMIFVNITFIKSKKQREISLCILW